MVKTQQFVLNQLCAYDSVLLNLYVFAIQSVAFTLVWYAMACHRIAWHGIMACHGMVWHGMVLSSKVCYGLGCVSYCTMLTQDMFLGYLYVFLCVVCFFIRRRTTAMDEDSLNDGRMSFIVIARLNIIGWPASTLVQQ